jgi:cell division protease FtsH
LFATRRKKEFVEQTDFSDAVDKVVMGPSRKSMKLSCKEKKVVAFHEAGHVLIAKLFAGADPVHKVTIIPRGQALGFTKQLPEDDRNLYTLKQLKALVAVLLGGRAAEEMILQEGEITSGASNDLQRATAIVKKMVYEWGMSEKAGLIVYKENNDFWGNSIGLDASDARKQKLEGIMDEILNGIYKDVVRCLNEKRNKFDALAGVLFEKETLNAEEIEKILNSAK